MQAWGTEEEEDPRGGFLYLLSPVLILPGTRHRKVQEMPRITQQGSVRAGTSLLDV